MSNNSFALKDSKSNDDNKTSQNDLKKQKDNINNSNLLSLPSSSSCASLLNMDDSFCTISDNEEWGSESTMINSIQIDNSTLPSTNVNLSSSESFQFLPFLKSSSSSSCQSSSNSKSNPNSIPDSLIEHDFQVSNTFPTTLLTQVHAESFKDYHQCNLSIYYEKEIDKLMNNNQVLNNECEQKMSEMNKKLELEIEHSSNLFNKLQRSEYNIKIRNEERQTVEAFHKSKIVNLEFAVRNLEEKLNQKNLAIGRILDFINAFNEDYK